MSRKSSIHTKLFILITAILMPIIILRVINIVDSYHLKVQNELSTYENLAEAISSSFNNYLEEIWMIESIVGIYLEEHPFLDTSQINAYLQLIIQKHEGIMSISWLDENGYIIASSNKVFPELSFSSRSYVKQIMSGKESVVSDLVESISRPNFYIFPVAHAIRSGDRLAGVVSAVIDTSKLQQRLPNLSFRSDIRYYLMDSQGMLVYCSNTGKTPDNQVCLIGDPEVSQAIQGKMVTSVKKKSEIDQTWIMSVDYPITDIGWNCRVFTPYHVAMAPYFQELIHELVVLIGIIFTSLLAAIILVRQILKPVSALRIATDRIMNGDYSARTHIKGHDEMALAAEAFDKMAESVEKWHETKNRFFTNMSHELKTPLNVLFSSVQLIENYKTSLDQALYPVKVSKQMKIIRQNCYRIMRLINDLIDISRHDSGFLKTKLFDFDIVKLTREITLSVQRYVEAKDIQLNYETELESLIMACDPDMIERVLLNLISNAIKFTDKNGAITVSLKRLEDTLILTVKDTGIGIPQDKLNFIFERFRQVDDSYLRNKEGSGIGLSLVKAFVEAHGGTVSVESETLKGTAFHIQLPIHVLGTEVSAEQGLKGGISQAGPAYGVSYINIEFSDIYSLYDEEIS